MRAPGPVGLGGAEREPGLLRRAAPAVCAFAAIRLLGLVTLAVWSHADGKKAHVLLSARWDSLWYVRVVQEGYGFTLVAPDGRRLSDLAFFPFFPWLEKTVAAATTLSEPDAGLLVSALASLVAAAGIFAVTERAAGARAALFTVTLWAALPVGIVESMAYSESLFTALASWALYSAAKERWITAGLLASLAGLTRATGLAVVLAVWAACALSVRRTGKVNGKVTGTVSARQVLGAALAPVGGAAYALWVGHRSGGPFGYFHVQRGWGNGLDGGVAFSVFLWRLGSHPPFLGGPALAAGVLALVFLWVQGFRRGVPPVVQVYTGAVMFLALGTSGYFGSKPRLLLPAFGLLIPVAMRLARLRPGRALTAVGALAAVSAAYGAFWLNGSGPP